MQGVLTVTYSSLHVLYAMIQLINLLNKVMHLTKLNECAVSCHSGQQFLALARSRI